MAYTKILVISNRLDKCLDYVQNEEKTALEAAIDYAMNQVKTERTCYESAINCDKARAYEDMLATKQRWGKEYRKRKGYHIIQSFAPGEVTPDEAHAVGVEFAHRLLSKRYEVIVTTHLDKAHLHNHIVFNAVSFLDGRMYLDRLRDYYGKNGVGIRGTSDAICREHGLSIIAPSETAKGSVERNEWEAARKGKATLRDSVRADLDAALLSAPSYPALLMQLRRMGYAVKAGPNVKHTAVRMPNGQRFIRLDSLGSGYSEADLKQRISQAPTVNKFSVTENEPLHKAQRRYHITHGKIHRHHTLTGFHALYIKYLLLLRGPQKHCKRRAVPYAIRRELLQLDRYQEQFLYLQKNHIETVEQLSMQYDELQTEIDALVERRATLYRWRRAGGEDADAQIAAITERLRQLRRELKLCTRMESDIPKLREQIIASRTKHPQEEIEKERGKADGRHRSR